MHGILLCRLGSMIAQVEGAAALVRRSARASTGQLHPKARERLNADSLTAVSRVNARNVALTVATAAARWVAGADGGELGGLEQRLDSSDDQARPERAARRPGGRRRRHLQRHKT
jgi:hypothetical protein